MEIGSVAYVLILLTNKQTDMGENIPSLAKVLIRVEFDHNFYRIA